jgi:4,5-dihydroxyphthalate decarboxylase
MKITLNDAGLADAAVGAASAAGAAAERVDVKPVHKASRGFVAGTGSELCEIAVVTLLQAAAYDMPVALLPATMLGRYQHQTLVTLGNLGVRDVRGRTVGARSWSQTTGVWVRGYLTEQYDVDLADVRWRTYEDGHLDAYTDPTWVGRAPEGTTLPADFLAGAVDFGIMGNELPSDERIRTAIPDARRVAEEWAAQKGYLPLNHVVGVTVDAAERDPKAVLAAYDALADAAARSATRPVGFDALRAPVTAAARYAYEQQVLPRRVEFDELVDRTCGALGVTAARLG